MDEEYIVKLTLAEIGELMTACSWHRHEMTELAPAFLSAEEKLDAVVRRAAEHPSQLNWQRIPRAGECKCTYAVPDCAEGERLYQEWRRLKGATEKPDFMQRPDHFDVIMGAVKAKARYQSHVEGNPSPLR